MLRLTNVGARLHPAQHTIGDRRATRPRNYAKSHSRSHNAVIRVYDDAGNVIETYEHKGRVQRVVKKFGAAILRKEIRRIAALLLNLRCRSLAAY